MMKAATFSPAVRAVRGSVLIAVLWVCLGLVSVTLLFGHSMLMNYRGVDNDVAGHQADQAIEGAARYVESLLVKTTTPGLFPDPLTTQSDAVPVGEATYWFLGRPADGSGGLTRQFGLVDEASKLNLNLGDPTDPAAMMALRTMLEALPGMTLELAAAITDWRDPDEDVADNGAESETYQSRQPAYTSKNGAFESIEELALLNGATREILYGEDANFNGVLEANEDDGDKSLPADNSDGKLDPGILEYVTWFSREPNKREDHTTPRVNISQPSTDLTTLLTETFGAQRAAEIEQNLITNPAPPTPPGPSVLDFYIRSNMSAEEFAKIEPSVSTSSQEYIYGLVNVNTASEAVLACLAGPDAAAALVSARLLRALGQDASIAWVKDALDPATYAGILPLLGSRITGQSWQISADIAAVGRHGRGYRREKIVIDQSTYTPRIVYRRNLAPLGWALGSEIRQNLALKKEVR